MKTLLARERLYDDYVGERNVRKCLIVRNTTC